MWKRLLLIALLFAPSAFAQQPGTHPGANERFLDPQLDAAIEHILAELNRDPYKPPPRPTPPDRSAMGIRDEDK